MSAALLSVDRLSIGTASGLPLVRDVSFDLAAGEIVAVVGESGSGKTMVSRAVLDLLPPGVVRTGGAIRLAGIDLARLDRNAMRKVRGGAVGMVFQEPMTSLNPAMPVGRQLEEALRLHTGCNRGERRRRILAMLERVAIPDPERCLAAYPHEFSGGMRQRIMLASVMLPKPKLLIADEPTTALDAVVQAEVMALMAELARENGTAVLLVSHDLSMVAHFARRVVVMQAGAVVEQGATEALLLSPQHPYTRRLLEALPRRGPARPPADGPPVVEVRDLVVDYAGRRRLVGRAAAKRAVDGVSLVVRPGETVAIVGGSGSGKTSLGKAIIGLVPTAGGAVLFRGTDPFADRRRLLDFRLGSQVVFQDPYSSLDPRMRVGAIVGEPLRHDAGLSARQKQARVVEALADVGLDEGHLGRYPHQLSGGQRQRVAIARAIVRRPAFVIADEPVSALDMTVQKQILALLAELQARYGFACLFISHDLAAVEQVADRVLVMEHGRIVEEGPRDRVFDAPRHAYTRRLLSAMTVLGAVGDDFALARRGGGWSAAAADGAPPAAGRGGAPENPVALAAGP